MLRHELSKVYKLLDKMPPLDGRLQSAFASVELDAVGSYTRPDVAALFLDHAHAVGVAQDDIDDERITQHLENVLTRWHDNASDRAPFTHVA